MSTFKCTVPLCRWSVEIKPIYDSESLRLNTKFNHLMNHHPIVWTLIEVRATFRRLRKVARK